MFAGCINQNFLSIEITFPSGPVSHNENYTPQQRMCALKSPNSRIRLRFSEIQTGKDNDSNFFFLFLPEQPPLT